MVPTFATTNLHGIRHSGDFCETTTLFFTFSAGFSSCLVGRATRGPPARMLRRGQRRSSRASGFSSGSVTATTAQGTPDARRSGDRRRTGRAETSAIAVMPKAQDGSSSLLVFVHRTPVRSPSRARHPARPDHKRTSHDRPFRSRHPASAAVRTSAAAARAAFTRLRFLVARFPASSCASRAASAALATSASDGGRRSQIE